MRLPLSICSLGSSLPRRARMRDRIRFEVLEERTLLASNLAATLLTAPPTARVGSGEQVEITWEVTNNGDDPFVADFWFDSIYLSDDALLDAFDELITFITPGVNPLNPNESYTWTETITIPNTLEGQRNILLVVNDESFAPEEDLSDNVLASPILLVGPDVDLQPTSFFLNAESVVAGQFFQANWGVFNAGSEFATGNRTNRITISTDNFLDASDTVLYEQSDTTPIGGQSILFGQAQVTVPSTLAAGSYFVFFETDVLNEQFETQDFNNGVVQPLEIVLTGPNLYVSDLATTTPWSLGETVDVSYTLHNDGSINADVPSLFQSYYLSLDDQLDVTEDVYLGDFESSFLLPINSGGSALAEVSLELFDGFTGAGFLLVVTDSLGQIAEEDESDNVASIEVFIEPPNLTATLLTAPSELRPGTFETVELTVQNNGLAPTYGFWQDSLYLSLDDVLDESDIFLSSASQPGSGEGPGDPIGPGESYTSFFSFFAPSVAGGNYHLIAVVDSESEQGDMDRTDNILVEPILLTSGPDLAISNLLVPETVILGDTIEVRYTVTNIGLEPTPDGWVDGVFLSLDDVLDPSDVPVDDGTYFDPTPLGPGESRDYVRQAPLRRGTPGEGRYLIVNVGQFIFDEDPSNNTAVVEVDALAPDLSVTSFSPPSDVVVGQSINFSWGVQNVGSVPALGIWSDRLYLSSDITIDASDFLVAAYNSFNDSPLAVGESYTAQRQASIPSVPAGTYYFLLQVAATNQPDVDPSNNLVLSGPITVGRADLVVSELTAPESATLGETISVTYTVSNQGDAMGATSLLDQFYLSDDTVLSVNDTLLDTQTVTTGLPLALGGSYTRTTNVSLGQGTAGTKYLLLRTDAAQQQGENDETNNTRAIEINLSSPDLAISEVVAPAVAGLGQTINVSFRVTNVGSVVAPADWFDLVHLADNPGGPNIILLRSVSAAASSPLAPGESYVVQTTVQIPTFVSTGPKYLRFLANGVSNRQPETTLANNGFASPIEIVVNAVNLEVTSATAPSEVATGKPFDVRWTVTNTGTVGATQTTSDAIYLSDDAVFDASDSRLQVLSGALLGAGASYDRQTSISLDGVVAGPKYLLIRTDISDSQPETDESDNFAAIPILVSGSDLIVELVSVPETATFGTPFNLTYRVRNVGNAPTGSLWTDRIVFSNATTTQVVHIEETPSNIPMLGVNEFYERTIAITIPAMFEGGTFLVGVGADIYNQQGETNNVNNSLVSDPIAIDLPPTPNLVVESIVAPVEGFTNQLVSVTWTVTNTGTADAVGTWFDRLRWVGQSNVEFEYFAFDGTLAPGASVTRTQTIAFPSTPGDYSLEIMTDITGVVIEGLNESDNTAISNVLSVVAPPLADLEIVSLSTPSDGVLSGELVSVTFVVKNIGNTATNVPTWNDWVLLSQDPSIEFEGFVVATSDQQIINQPDAPTPFANPIALNPGESYTQTVDVQIPPDKTGTWYVYVIADGIGAHFSPYPTLRESNEANNLRRSDGFRVDQGPTADLVVDAVLAPTFAFSGQSIEVSWTGTNAGPAPTRVASWYDNIYLSTDSTFDESDVFLGEFQHEGTLGSSESYAGQGTVKLPIGLSGSYFLIAVADASENVFEVPSELNNTRSAPIEINLTPPPDLVIEEPTVPTEAASGLPMQVEFRVANRGATSTVSGYWTDAVYLSPTAILGDDAMFLGEWGRVTDLAPGTSYSVSATVTPPAGLQGDYFVILATDIRNRVFELDRTNNVYAAAISLNSTPADLVAEITASASVDAGATMLVEWTTRNIGSGPTNESEWEDLVVYSTDDLFDPGDVVLGRFTRIGTLAAREEYIRRENVAIPIDASGSGRILVVSDAGDNVFEGAGESNNVASSAVVVSPRVVDLQVVSITPLSAPNVGATLTLSWTVTNFGTGSANGYWYDDVYLSTDPSVSADDRYLGSALHQGTLASGEIYTSTRDVQLSKNLPPGEYFIIVRADRPVPSDFFDETANLVYEQGAEANNDLAQPIQVVFGPTPDLLVTNFDAPASGFAGRSIEVSWTTRNVGAVAANQLWVDAVYLSEDQIFDSGRDIRLGYIQRPAELGTGEEYSVSGAFQLPKWFTGPAYVFVVSDAGAIVLEVNERNNIGYDPQSILIESPPAVAVDLVVGTFALPEFATIGTELSLTYGVENLSANDAVGDWNDAIYLSTDSIWDANDALFARTRHTGGLVSGGSYSETVTGPVPILPPGEYFVILRTDARNQVVETNEANNIGASLEDVSLNVPSLTLGVAASGSLSQGQSRAFRVDALEGQTLRLTLSGEASARGAILFARYGQIATAAEFDEIAPAVAGSNTIVIPSASEGSYFILIRTDSVGEDQDFTILAESLPFGIESLTNSRGGQSGSLTLGIDGAGFTSNTRVQLVGQGTVITPEWTNIESSARINATFNLVGQPLGTYDVHVFTDTSAFLFDPATEETTVIDFRVEEDVLESGFEIVRSTLSEAKSQLMMPAFVRNGQRFTFQVRVWNDSDNDVAAPVYLVESLTDLPVSMTADVSDTDPRWEQFVAAGGRRRMVLAPGESVIVTLYSIAAGERVEYGVRQQRFTDEIVEWDYMQDYYREVDDDAVWAQTWSNFRGIVGSTFSELYNVLRLSAADKLAFTSDRPEAVNAAELLSDLFLRAAYGQSDASDFVYPQSGVEVGLNVPFTRLGPVLEVESGLAPNLNPTADQSYPIAPSSDASRSEFQLEAFDELDAIEAALRATLVPAATAAFHSQAASVIENFLNGSSANIPLPRIFREGDPVVDGGGGLKGSQSVVELVEKYLLPTILKELGKKLSSKEIASAPGSHKVEIFVPEGTPNFENGLGDVKLNFSRSSEVGTLLIGGTGSSPFGKDNRRIFGDVVLKYSEPPPECGPYYLDVEFYLTMNIKDAFDFLDGDLGASPLVQLFTRPLRQLEANDRAFAVPIGAEFQIDIDNSKFKRLVRVDPEKKDRKPPPPPSNPCLKLPDPPPNSCPKRPMPPSPPPDKNCPKDPPPDHTGGSPNAGAYDPNDIIGPIGFGPDRIVSGSETLAYTIRFENIAEATAAAQSVLITQQLDSDLDWSSFRLGTIAFADQVIELDGTSPFFATRLDLSADQQIFVDIAAFVDTSTGLLTWKFQAIDSQTGEPPSETLGGLLPPNEVPGEGEGFVTYYIQARGDAASGARVDAEATIVFDTELPIQTPSIFNKLDTVAPTSQVDPLAATTTDPTFFVGWSGEDDSEGSAIDLYDIYVSVNRGAYELWLDDTELTEATFVGAAGNTYAFVSIAIDNAGNVEAFPDSPDSEITVLAPDPAMTVVAPPTSLVQRPVEFQVTVENVSPLPSGEYLYLFDWNNDGQAERVQSGGASISVEHAFASAGVHEYRVWIVNVNLQAVIEATGSIEILAFTTEPDLNDPTKFILRWGGTAGDDHYMFSDSSVRILRENGQAMDTTYVLPGPISGIVAFGGDGNDILDASGVSVPVTLTGGAGADELHGGSADDWIEGDGAEGSGAAETATDIGGRSGGDWIDGGAGNDILFGDSALLATTSRSDTILGGDGDDTIVVDGPEGSAANTVLAGSGDDIVLGGRRADSIDGEDGRDILIGGEGADVLQGGADSDLLVAGGIANIDLAGLSLIRAEWVSAQPLNVRVDNLSGVGIGERENADVFLTAGVTALRDQAVDTVLGGEDGDWLLLESTQDIANDLDPLVDIVTEL